MDDRKSISCGYFYLESNIVAWHIKEQNAVSSSTAEAKYIAVGMYCTHRLWMSKMLSDYDIEQNVMTLYCENMNAINISKNLVQHFRTNYKVQACYNFI